MERGEVGGTTLAGPGSVMDRWGEEVPGRAFPGVAL